MGATSFFSGLLGVAEQAYFLDGDKLAATNFVLQTNATAWALISEVNPATIPMAISSGTLAFGAESGILGVDIVKWFQILNGRTLKDPDGTPISLEMQTLKAAGDLTTLVGDGLIVLGSWVKVIPIFGIEAGEGIDAIGAGATAVGTIIDIWDHPTVRAAVSSYIRTQFYSAVQEISDSLELDPFVAGGRAGWSPPATAPDASQNFDNIPEFIDTGYRSGAPDTYQTIEAQSGESAVSSTAQNSNDIPEIIVSSQRDPGGVTALTPDQVSPRFIKIPNLELPNIDFSNNIVNNSGGDGGAGSTDNGGAGAGSTDNGIYSGGSDALNNSLDNVASAFDGWDSSFNSGTFNFNAVYGDDGKLIGFVNKSSGQFTPTSGNGPGGAGSAAASGGFKLPDGSFDGYGGGIDGPPSTGSLFSRLTGNTGSGPGSAAHTVLPVVLDLAGNGIKITPLGSSNTFLNIAGDGYEHQTAWVGAGNGVLLYDPTGSSTITQQMVDFTSWDPTATSDMQALKDVFDTNQDGQLDADDSEWNSFRVLVTNANGTTSLETLQQLGITSINLTSNKQSQSFADGSRINGETTYTANGQTRTAADVSLAYDPNGYVTSQTVTTNGNGSTTITVAAYNPDGSVAGSTARTTSQENMRRIVRGRTVLIIAHRLSAVRHADRILTIDRGRLVEDGNHEDLIRSNGRYAALHRIQAGMQNAV